MAKSILISSASTTNKYPHNIGILLCMYKKLDKSPICTPASISTCFLSKSKDIFWWFFLRSTIQWSSAADLLVVPPLDTKNGFEVLWNNSEVTTSITPSNSLSLELRFWSGSKFLIILSFFYNEFLKLIFYKTIFN